MTREMYVEFVDVGRNQIAHSFILANVREASNTFINVVWNVG
jgi:hypothetical protein